MDITANVVSYGSNTLRNLLSMLDGVVNFRLNFKKFVN